MRVVCLWKDKNPQMTNATLECVNIAFIVEVFIFYDKFNSATISQLTTHFIRRYISLRKIKSRSFVKKVRKTTFHENINPENTDRIQEGSTSGHKSFMAYFFSKKAIHTLCKKCC